MGGDEDTVQLSRPLAAALGLPQRAPVDDVAARTARLGGVREPRRPASRRLLALAAVAADELAAELFAGIDDPDLVLLGPVDDVIAELLEQLGPVSERELCEDLGAPSAQQPREALDEHLSSVMDAVAAAVWARGSGR